MTVRIEIRGIVRCHKVWAAKRTHTRAMRRDTEKQVHGLLDIKNPLAPQNHFWWQPS